VRRIDLLRGGQLGVKKTQKDARMDWTFSFVLRKITIARRLRYPGGDPHGNRQTAKFSGRAPFETRRHEWRRGTHECVRTFYAIRAMMHGLVWEKEQRS